MRIVAMIPIKMNSKRIPNKNTKVFFDGTPLMSFIQDTCLKSNYIDDTYVFCSDERVKPYVLPGVRYLKRPDYLDKDDINANDIISEFIKLVDADIYVNAHTTSPFARVETIDSCIHAVADNSYDSAFCAESIKTFMWKDDQPLNFDPDHFPRTQDLPPIYGETSIAYVFKKDTFMTYNRRVGVRPYIQVVGRIEAIDIDYPEEFDVANAVYKEIFCR